MSSDPLYVSIVIDVEEEGLFSGSYPRRVTVDNVQALPTLASLTTECGIPLSLVCNEPVFTDPEARRVLLHMRDTYGAEIGAHLHYWSTPPLEEGGQPMQRYVAAKDVPVELMRAKLSSLFRAAGECCGQEVTTFRMGRWDMARELWPLLEEQGVKVDSSIRPWQYPAGWRDHFMAPTHPYTLTVNGRDILEVPDTAVSWLPQSMAPYCHQAPAFLLHKWHQLVVMAPSPVYHGLSYMKMAARLMLVRGYKVLNLTWHSSEIVPGATPHLPSKQDVENMLGKAKAFLQWLGKETDICGVTLGQLAQCGISAPPLDDHSLSLPGDWHP